MLFVRNAGDGCSEDADMTDSQMISVAMDWLDFPTHLSLSLAIWLGSAMTHRQITLFFSTSVSHS